MFEYIENSFDEDSLISQINTFDTVNKINSMKNNGLIYNKSLWLIKIL